MILYPVIGYRIPKRAGLWPAEYNLAAVFPVTACNAAQGHGNHWFAPHLTLQGAYGQPRGTKKTLSRATLAP